MLRFDKKIIFLGFFLLFMFVVIGYLIIVIWPPNFEDNAKGSDYQISLLGKIYNIDLDTGLILLVLLVGGLGSFIHASTSFATFVGNRSFISSWLWWYLFRPFIGMAIALILYFVVRAGLVFLTTEQNISINPFGAAAIAGLSGMFSKQATDKLRDIFDNLFKTASGKGDEQRADKLLEMRPVEDIMVEKSRMSFYQLKQDESESDVKIEKLYKMLKGVVTRIPVLDYNGVAKCIIHQSMLYKFITEKMMEEPGKTVDIASLTLQDFFNFKEMKEFVHNSMVFIPIAAKLGEAKTEMEKIKICQDVFVTLNGKAEEPILGWLTNTEISKSLKA